MAAGLPVIVSDWDGYKDTVRDGIDGIRIPTLTPPAPTGADLAQRYDNGSDTYDAYCGYTSQFTALDPVALEDACDRLIGDAGLRKQMGDAGRLRARQSFDWSVVYRRYQDLWGELAERRRADPDLHPSSLPVPLMRPDRPDPFAAFAGYPTSRLSGDHLVELLDGAASLDARRDLAINSFARDLQPNAADCAAILDTLRRSGPQPASAIIQGFPASQRVSIARGLVWLAKMEAVRITAPARATSVSPK
jgi:hypothetical protein